MSSSSTESLTPCVLPHLSYLRRSGLSPSTYAAYHRAVDTFLRVCRLNYSILLTLDTITIDLYLAAWITSEYDAGGSYGYAEHARHGLHFFLPRVKNQLHESHALLRGWKRHRPSEAHPPLPKNIAVLMAVTLAAQGDFHAGLAVLLSFDCYLRINECMQLRACDVTIPFDSRMGARYTRCAVHLRTTKTLDNLSCTISDPVVARLLHRCVLSCESPNDFIFPFKAAVFRKHYFTATLARLGLAHLHFVPHSLRHGGATHDFVILGRSEAYVQKRGRWASQKSTNRYIQTLAATDLTYQVPAKLNDAGACFNSHLEFIMDYAVKEADVDLPSLPSLNSDT